MQTLIQCLPGTGKRRLIFATGIAALLSAGVAHAADMHGSFKDAPVVEDAVPNWAGLYVGGVIGYGNGDTTETNLDGNGYMNDTLDVNGTIYGVHAGYNFQRGALVLGVEGAFNGTNIDETLTRDAVVGGEYLLERKLEWYSTLTGRLGYARGSLLFYGLGGAAWGKSKTVESVAGSEGHDFANSESKTQTGWTAGGGVEYALRDNFSVRFEYAHLGFGDTKIFNGTQEVDLDVDTFKFGASYKLNRDREPLK